MSETYWEATRRHELVIQWCRGCDAGIYFPRELCPRCQSVDLTWRPASGHGVVYAHAHHPVPDGPGYVVALVDLAEGVRMLTNIVQCPPEQVVVGMPVTVTWQPLDDGRALPVFGPDVTDEKEP